MNTSPARLRRNTSRSCPSRTGRVPYSRRSGKPLDAQRRPEGRRQPKRADPVWRQAANGFVAFPRCRLMKFPISTPTRKERHATVYLSFSGLNHAHGMEFYLYMNDILFKDYDSHVKWVSQRLKT